MEYAHIHTVHQYPYTIVHIVKCSYHSLSAHTLYGMAQAECLDSSHTMGCRRRGRPQDKPFDPETGQGFAQAVEGQMHDALKNKRSNVVTFIVESTAAITPRARKYCYELKGRTEGRGATDRTKCGTNPNSPKSFIVHHVQRIVRAVVMYDASTRGYSYM